MLWPWTTFDPSPLDAIEGDIELQALMDVQQRFKTVLNQTAGGISLPLEMLDSERGMRHLRILLGFSDLEHSDRLELECDSFIKDVHDSIDNMINFNSEVVSVIEGVISANQYTFSVIRGVAKDRESKGWFANWTGWLLKPTISLESKLRNMYQENTRELLFLLANLIEQGENILHALRRANGRLSTIHKLATESQDSVQSQKDDTLRQLWTRLGGNTIKLHNYESDFILVQLMTRRRDEAERRVDGLVIEFKKIREGLINSNDQSHILHPHILHPELILLDRRSQLASISRPWVRLPRSWSCCSTMSTSWKPRCGSGGRRRASQRIG